jgi:FAD/FMN-containing dehydrogenase/Fe-S oxidoreductase
MNLTAEQLTALENSLSAAISGEVHVDPYFCALYSTDASLYQIQPACVVIPKSADDVAAAVRAAAEYGLPIIPRGSGTSLSGQSIGAGMVVDFSKYMNAILELDTQASTARVQPGVVLDQLNRRAARHGLQFGPDVATSSRANLGGMIGNNSAGARSIRHGKTVDHVIELAVVLADGSTTRFGPLTPAQLQEAASGQGLAARACREVPRIVADCKDEVLARYPKILRRVSGYNLDELIPETRHWYPPPESVARVRQIEAARFPAADFNLSKLIVGAEGTLGVATEALVHLVPLPPHRGIVVLHFEALDHTCAALESALQFAPSAVEFLDKLIVQLARQSLEYRHYLDFVVGEPESLMIVEFCGPSPDEVRGKVNELAAALHGRPGLYHILPALEPRLCDHIWACRKASLPLLMGIPGNRKPIAFVEDTAVHPGRLPEFVKRFRQIVHRHGTDGAFYGHASVGCLHIRPLLDPADRGDLERIRQISLEVADLVLEFGGAMSGEHGDGLARSYLNPRLFGPRLYQAFKEIKAAFDPQNLLNPGKIVDGPSPVENLRMGANDRTLKVRTALDFSSQGGLARAAELCNGSGLCRKTQTGTMCPSFMATGDEEHSTRGRANALRLVLSGVLPPEQLTGPRLYQTFDLCLQCKGCKAECPSNVDVAKLKVEFLAQYYGKHGVPWGAWALGHVARLNRLGAALAPVSNWVAALPGAAWLREKLLGIDRRRPLPAFHRNHFARWFRNHRRPPKPAPRGKIILLDDCLTSYCEPGVNQAAVELLEAAGYEVLLAGLHCCGRALISKGLVDEAKKLARQNIGRLLPAVRSGVIVTGCEPSCLLTLADDYLDLVPGDEAREVADRVRLIDTHLVREKIELPLAAGESSHDVILHAHCHQRALVGARDTVRALQMVPGTQVKLLDSGCCGMAGSFGYEHYDLSMKIGQRVLFPAVHAAGAAAIVAPGFSCRHQIAQATGKQPLHPAEYLVQRLHGGQQQ